MALSRSAKEKLIIALASRTAGAEVASAIDAIHVAAAAADVAANSSAGAVTVTTAGGNTYSDAAINVALASLVSDINADRTQINAILAALKNAGLMS